MTKKKAEQTQNVPNVAMWINEDGTIEWKGENIDAKTVIMMGNILTIDGLRLLEELPTVPRKIDTPKRKK